MRTTIITRDGPLATESAAVAETLVVPGEAFSSRVSRRYLASLMAQALAPSLPLDGNYPFLHPERKFMHLGFHIYDVGFQSPNVEAARPLVYATALLLVVVILLLNMVAIHVRNGLREKYKGLET